MRSVDDVSAILLESAGRLLGDLSDFDAARSIEPERSEAGWRQIEEMGLPLALVDEAHGGLGVDKATAYELVQLCGRYVVPYPVVETMLANQFAAQAGEALPDGQVSVPDASIDVRREQAALARAKQMVGALETILAMTISHVEDRRQFSRPISKFQAVQHSLAIIAGEVAAAAAAADHAVGKLDEGGVAVTLAIGIARARIGEACSKVSALAHQLHGAIGYTSEHRLHLYTKAVWKWRDEFGTQAWWTQLVGRMVLEKGRDSFWPAVTAA